MIRMVKYFLKKRKIFQKLLNQRYLETREITNGIDYSELVYETKSGITIDFSVYKKPSDLYFLIINSYTKL